MDYNGKSTNFPPKVAFHPGVYYSNRNPVYVYGETMPMCMEKLASGVFDYFLGTGP